MISASEGLSRLRQGNARFVEGAGGTRTATPDRRAELAAGQEPFAIVLGCSDSRVPPELVFDQGLGDLFVIRVAGNIAAEAQIGSIEFAAVEFGTRLVVVLGHSGCGAITATIGELRQPSPRLSSNLSSIVDRIGVCLRGLVETQGENAGLVDEAVRTNVQNVTQTLVSDSSLLRDLCANDGLMIVGAQYCVDTGVVEFLDNVNPAIKGDPA